MVNKAHTSFSMRPEVQKNKEFKALSTKPMHELTDKQLSLVYSVQFKYIADIEPPALKDSICKCSLCQIRRGELTVEQLKEMVWGKPKV